MRKRRDYGTVKPKRGRPVTHPMPDAIPDTPENIARAVLRSPAVPLGGWKYLRDARKIRKKAS